MLMKGPWYRGISTIWLLFAMIVGLCMQYSHVPLLRFVTLGMIAGVVFAALRLADDHGDTFAEDAERRSPPPAWMKPYDRAIKIFMTLINVLLFAFAVLTGDLFRNFHQLLTAETYRRIAQEFHPLEEEAQRALDAD